MNAPALLPWVPYDQELPLKGHGFLLDDASHLFASFDRFHPQVIVSSSRGRHIKFSPPIVSHTSPNLHRMFDIESSDTLLPSVAQMCIIYRGLRLKNLDGLCSNTLVVGRFGLPHEGDSCVAKWMGSPSGNDDNVADGQLSSVGAVSNVNRKLPEFKLISAIGCPEMPSLLDHWIVV